jgi:mono/diheme cytochrome c family protein
LLNGLPRCRWLVVVIALLAARHVISLLASARVLTPRPGTVSATPTAGVVLAAGSGGGRRGTAQSNYRSECATCHGATGKGDGWTAWLFRLRMQDMTDPAQMRTLTDDYIFQIIKQGGASLGKPGMPSWGQEFTDQEIRDLVVYIRSVARPPEQPQSTGAGH